MFAQGLYEQAQRRSQEENVSLDRAFTTEVQEMTVFLAALDEHYVELRRTLKVDQAMRELVVWAESHKNSTQ
jgi:hypothetical protein